MRHYEYELLGTFERDGFTVIVDKTWEDMPLRHCFDDECYDIKEMEQQVDRCDLDWFMLRVRALLDGHELGSRHLGGCLYKDAREVMTDGTVEDQLIEVLHEAREEARRLQGSLQQVLDAATV